MPKRPASSTRAFSDSRSFRPELHGVRGLAILLVVLFHIFGAGKVSGGIDVFLAITGFLAIPSLLRRTGKTWRIDLIKRFSGLIRRLFIPLLPVLVAVGVAGIFLTPLSEQPQLYAELQASIFFYENWELINSQLTYDAAGPQTSPLQHIWSTSIQGQFHVAMTFLIMLVAFIATKAGLTKKSTLIGVLLIVSAASFGWAIHDTANSQASAYFSTFSRAWELTLPGVLGLVVGNIKLGPVTRGIMSWVGITLIVSCGFVLDGAALFPGPAALWPVLGVCLVLTAGKTRTRWGADRMLRKWPFQRIGDISYSLYLWHWPILIYTLAATGQERADTQTAVFVLALSLVAGYLGKKFFEDGAANWKLAFPHPVRSLATGTTAVVSSFILASGALAFSEEELEATVIEFEESLVNADYPGAGAMMAPAYMVIESRTPAPEKDILKVDVGWQREANLESPCIQRKDGTDPTSCQHPVADSGPLVIMAGSSHTGQWSAAIGELAEEYGWDLELYEKSGCLLTTDPEDNEAGIQVTPSCVEWNENVMATIAQRQPDLVMTTGTTRLGTEPEMTSEGMVQAVDRITDMGIPVFLFRENPEQTEEWLSCIQEANGDAHTECGQDRDAFYSATIDEQGYPLDRPTIDMFDTSEYLCDNSECYGTVGNVYVLRDENHLSATFVNSARPFIEEQMRASYPELFNLPLMSYADKGIN